MGQVPASEINAVYDYIASCGLFWRQIIVVRLWLGATVGKGHVRVAGRGRVRHTPVAPFGTEETSRHAMRIPARGRPDSEC